MGSQHPSIDSKPIDIDSEVAHSSRVYDYLLGGFNNFPVDREAAERLGEALGGLDKLRSHARANRAFLGRVVRYLVAEAGIRQFLDIGTGVPNADNTHAVAQHVAPESRIVYVDNDPIVLAHAHSLLKSTEEGATGYIYGDLREPDSVLERAADTLDFDRPVAVILVAVLHLVDPAEDPHRLVARLREVLCPGSYLALSHLTSEIRPEESRTGASVMSRMTRESFTLRDRNDIAGFLDGLELVDPGLVQIEEWRPDPPGEQRDAGVVDGTPVVPAPYLGAVGLLPG